MIFKALFLVLFGAALVLGNPVFENFETTTKKETRDIIEIDDTTNKGIGIDVPEPEPDTDDANELPSGGFSTFPPTPEPTVGEEELPEDLTEKPANSGKDETVQDKVEKWIGGVEEKVKDHFEGKKEIVKDTWDSIKNTWNKWSLF